MTLRSWWKKRIVKLCFAIVVAGSVAGYGLWFVHDNGVVMTAFSVGQGDAILIRVGTNEVLVDGGPSPVIRQKLGKAMPFFDRTIEYVVLTHPHRDHYFGLLAVLADYRVNELWLSGLDSDDADYKEVIVRARRAGTKIVIVKQGDSLFLRDDVALRVLMAKDDLPIVKQSPDIDPNEASIVSELDILEQGSGRTFLSNIFGNKRMNQNGMWVPKVLLMGDAPSTIEEMLMQKGLVRPTPFLKVGHHGSKYSSSEKFLDTVRPQLAVISVGKNTYGHPAPSLLSRLKFRNIRAWRTDKDGDAEVRL